MSQKETLASFQWYFVDEVFSYNAVVGTSTVEDGSAVSRRRRRSFFSPLVFAPGRFEADRCPQDVTKRPVDFLVMLDKSGGMGESQFRLLLRCTAFLVKNAIPTITLETTRFALMSFANQPVVEFDLDTCRNKSCVLERIPKAVFTGGLTRMATALDEARMEVYNEARGMRACSRRVLLLFTDGGSGAYDTIPVRIAADMLKREKSVEIFAVAITELVNEEELVDTVSSPSLTHLYYMSTIRQTRRIFKKLRSAAVSSRTHSQH